MWATTTPVDEDLHHRNKGFDRFTTDVDAYNSVALELAAALEVAVNDLHAVIDGAVCVHRLRDAGLQPTRVGSHALGELPLRVTALPMDRRSHCCPRRRRRPRHRPWRPCRRPRNQYDRQRRLLLPGIHYR